MSHWQVCELFLRALRSGFGLKGAKMRNLVLMWVLAGAAVILGVAVILTITPNTFLWRAYWEYVHNYERLTKYPWKSGATTATLSQDGKTLTVSGKGRMKDCYYWTAVDYFDDDSGDSHDGVMVPWVGVMDSIINVVIEEGVTYVGEGAFYRSSNLKSVKLPNSLTSIGERAFSHCDSLTSITVPDAVASIGKGAFAECRNLTSVTIGNGVTTIGNWAFENCKRLVHIMIPAGVVSIGKNAFSGTGFIDAAENNPRYSSIDGVLFNKDKTTLIQYPSRKKETSYTIPNGVTTIGKSAFLFCDSLTSIIIPNGVISIEENAFLGCGLISIIIPYSVASIGEDAFLGCRGLKSVTISDNEISIGGEAFGSCFSLESVIISNPIPPNADKVLFSGINIRTHPCLYVPENGIDAYRSAEGWNEFECIKAIASAPK
jgi:hypothetical protein